MYTINKKPRNLEFIEFYNNDNFHVILSNYGASIYEIDMPNKNGTLETVTLTPKSPYYFENNKYLGLTVGRVAGRIEKGELYLNKKKYILEPNENGNVLHSSKYTLAYKFFDYSVKETKDYTEVCFTKHVNDMEDGFPGNLDLIVKYILSNNKSNIRIEYIAYSDKDTYMNFTNHSYFNLSGNLKETILNHTLKMNKDKRSVLRNDLIFKEIIPVTKEFDFRKGLRIGEYIESDVVQDVARGYDHMFCGDDNVLLTLKDNESNRKLTIKSDYKDCVIYTNNYKTDTVYINDCVDKRYLGIAIEPSRLSYSLIKGGLTQNARKLYKHYIEYIFELED